ncbi:hypothetical protein PG991_001081 [Apiospora marii]|uniref:Secreted protein n=1 Tax=Apiospora marii TaxID=335849 RepID=A0ABR1STS7_9PEZI
MRGDAVAVLAVVLYQLNLPPRHKEAGVKQPTRPGIQKLATTETSEISVFGKAELRRKLGGRVVERVQLYAAVAVDVAGGEVSGQELEELAAVVFGNSAANPPMAWLAPPSATEGRPVQVVQRHEGEVAYHVANNLFNQFHRKVQQTKTRTGRRATWHKSRHGNIPSALVKPQLTTPSKRQAHGALLVSTTDKAIPRVLVWSRHPHGVHVPGDGAALARQPFPPVHDGVEDRVFRTVGAVPLRRRLDEVEAGDAANTARRQRYGLLPRVRVSFHMPPMCARRASVPAKPGGVVALAVVGRVPDGVRPQVGADPVRRGVEILPRGSLRTGGAGSLYNELVLDEKNHVFLVHAWHKLDPPTPARGGLRREHGLVQPRRHPYRDFNVATKLLRVDSVSVPGIVLHQGALALVLGISVTLLGINVTGIHIQHAGDDAVGGLGRRVPEAVQLHAVAAVHEPVDQILGQTTLEKLTTSPGIDVSTFRSKAPTPEGDPVHVAQVVAMQH